MLWLLRGSVLAAHTPGSVGTLAIMPWEVARFAPDDGSALSSASPKVGASSRTSNEPRGFRPYWLRPSRRILIEKPCGTAQNVTQDSWLSAAMHGL